MCFTTPPTSECHDCNAGIGLGGDGTASGAHGPGCIVSGNEEFWIVGRWGQHGGVMLMGTLWKQILKIEPKNNSMIVCRALYFVLVLCVLNILVII